MFFVISPLKFSTLKIYALVGNETFFFFCLPETPVQPERRGRTVTCRQYTFLGIEKKKRKLIR